MTGPKGAFSLSICYQFDYTSAFDPPESESFVPTKWIAWQQVTSLLQADDTARILQSVEQLVDVAILTTTASEFLKTQLPKLAGELAANSVGVYAKTPEWIELAQHGRVGLSDLPKSQLMEVLDRDAGYFGPIEGMSGTFMVAVPLRSRSRTGAVLVFAGRSFPDDALPAAMLASKAIGACIDFINRSEKSVRRTEQLESILKIALNLSAVHETEPLLELIAREATRLLDCDRASIFIWDKDHHEVVACPALGVEGNSLRIPDNAGIVGEVIHSGAMLRIDDAYTDSRFNRKVDSSSGYKTRNLLCGPLYGTDKKLLGAFEAINKNHGSFTEEDEVALADLSLQVASALQNARERESLLRSHRQLTEQVTKGVTIIGESPAMKAMRGTVLRLASTDLPVLILGESGTGKEVVAQSLHYQGPRATRPFIAVNCAALTETLLESELFGHEKGAFTDAREMHRGKFEIAEGGTIFLDEIGDMSPGGQAKLLRVLEQKVITRVGGSQSIPINARVIAATNSHLADAVRAKKFREDLYFRLNVVTLELPSLRDRAEDILPLAEFFLHQFAAQARRTNLQLSPDARSRLQSHSWPGNVRELRNLMERVAFLAAGDMVEPEDLAFIISPEKKNIYEPSLDLGLGEATSGFQQDFIRRAIRRVRGNMTDASKLLGVHRSNLYRKMLQLGMKEATDPNSDFVEVD